MEQETQSERYIRKLETHLEDAKSSAKYSSDRFDILIITISSTALVTTIGFARYFLGEIENVNTNLLKVGWLLFVITIISNLLSQLSAYYSHIYDVKATTNLIRIEREKEPKGNKEKIETICNRLSSLTTYLNHASLATLIVGIIVIVLFFSNNI